MFICMLGFYSLASLISVGSTNAESEIPTASVYLLPMQQDTWVITISAESVDVFSEPGGQLIAQLVNGERITVNCDYSDQPGWCQIVEGRLKGYFVMGRDFD